MKATHPVGVNFSINFFGFSGEISIIKMGRLFRQFPSELPCAWRVAYHPELPCYIYCERMPRVIKQLDVAIIMVKGLLRRFISILLINSAMAFRKLTENSVFFWKNGLQLKTLEMPQVLYTFNTTGMQKNSSVQLEVSCYYAIIRYYYYSKV